jgi:hypothetical protein
LGRIIELIRIHGKSNLEGIILAILVTSFLTHYFVPQILRETPVVFCVVSFFLAFSRNSKRSILIYSSILTLLHGGFVVLLILSMIRILKISKRWPRVFFVGIILFVLGLLYSNGVSIYKLSFNTEEIKDFEYVAQQTTGGIGYALEGSYTKEYQFTSITSYIYFYLKSMFYFFLKPFFYEGAAISYPLNFYKSTSGLILCVLLLRKRSITSRFKTEYLFLLIIISIFAISTSQYGQALRHFSKFFFVLVTYAFMDFYRPSQIVDRMIVRGIIVFNISFFLLYFISVLV